MRKTIGITRRNLVRASLGVAALSAGGRLRADVTPSQIEGPFYPVHEQPDTDADLTLVEGHAERALGEIIDVSGRVLDEVGQPVGGALIDVWQANTHGRYAHEDDPNPAPLDNNFQGWAKLKTGADGRYRITSIKPGAYPVGDGWSRPPHIHFKVALRGYHELTTQMYFAGDRLNDIDRLLQMVPENERGKLVVAFSERDGVMAGVFDITLKKV